MSGPPETPPGGDQTRIAFGEGREPGAGDTGVRLDLDADRVGWIIFDKPGESVNTLDLALMERFRDLLDEARRTDALGLVLVSDKPDMFIAGADIGLIAGVTDARAGAEKAAYGQSVFEALARFPGPTVAVVNGPCVGGGYEMALACDRILVERNEAVRVGLPEIQLGILPGFGGTQRLPRRVGLPVALDVILAGKTLPGKPAFKRAMVDALVPPGEGRRVAAEWVRGERRIERRGPGVRDRWMSRLAPLRRLVFGRARTALGKRVREEHYPAPYRALRAVEAGYTTGEIAAYRTEAVLLGELIVTPASKNLTWLFQQQRRAKSPAGLDLDGAKPVRRLGLLGAGIMGGGIAWLAADRRLPVRVKDIAVPALESALRTAGEVWNRRVRRRRLTPAQVADRVQSISWTLDYSGFGRTDLVIEAVVEDLGIKHIVLGEVQDHVREHTVLASNTSSLSIDAIADGVRDPGRVVGLHFFNPVDRMPLVEVVAGPRSRPEAIATAFRLALDLGKTPVLVADGPGFLVNRLLAFYLGEALHLFERGAAPDRVDRQLVAFGMPMGPFALLDQIGLDVAEKVTGVLGEAFGERLPPQATVGRLVREGHLGRKSGRGFYVYEDGKEHWPSREAHAAGGKPARFEPEDEDVLDRLVLPMINEAARCLDEVIVRRPLDVDLAMVMGTGFPPFRGGLLRYADARGVTRIIDRLGLMSERIDGRFAPSSALRQRQGGFYGF